MQKMKKESALDQITATVRVIAEVSGKEASSIERNMELVADLGLDSAKALELLVKIEDALDLEIDEDDAARLNTVGDIFDYLNPPAASV